MLGQNTDPRWLRPAIVLIIVVGMVALVVFTVMQIQSQDPVYQRAKELLLIVNTVLTTVVGYYFGNASAATSERAAATSERAASEASKRAQEESVAARRAESALYDTRVDLAQVKSEKDFNDEQLSKTKNGLKDLVSSATPIINGFESVNRTSDEASALATNMDNLRRAVAKAQLLLDE